MFSPADVAYLRDQFAKQEDKMTRSNHLQEAIRKADRAIGQEPPYDQLFSQLACAYAQIALVERMDALLERLDAMTESDYDPDYPKHFLRVDRR